MNFKVFGRKRSWSIFKVLYQHSCGGTEENHKICRDSRSPGRDMNPRPSEYEAEVMNKIIISEEQLWKRRLVK
jgi:hypothetical protein